MTAGVGFVGIGFTETFLPNTMRVNMELLRRPQSLLTDRYRPNLIVNWDGVLWKDVHESRKTLLVTRLTVSQSLYMKASRVMKEG
jgi:hypothetical protein